MGVLQDWGAVCHGSLRLAASLPCTPGSSVTRSSLEGDDLADDLAALHRVEGVVDLVELDAAGDHAVEVEGAVLPEAEELVEVGADVGRPVVGADEVLLGEEQLE